MCTPTATIRMYVGWNLQECDLGHIHYPLAVHKAPE